MKEVLIAEFYNRLKKELGVSIRVARAIHKGYKAVYLQCVANGESFALPGIGSIELRPYPTDEALNPKTKKMVKRQAKYRIIFSASNTAKRLVGKRI